MFVYFSVFEDFHFGTLLLAPGDTNQPAHRYSLSYSGSGNCTGNWVQNQREKNSW
jgi:hypothetical protein